MSTMGLYNMFWFGRLWHLNVIQKNHCWFQVIWLWLLRFLALQQFNIDILWLATWNASYSKFVFQILCLQQTLQIFQMQLLATGAPKLRSTDNIVQIFFLFQSSPFKPCVLQPAPKLMDAGLHNDMVKWLRNRSRHHKRLAQPKLA